jgi:hypothetical protein
MRGMIAISVFLIMASPAMAQQRCIVTDPTDTPLNVRRTPGGPIVGTYDNGTILRVTRTERDGQGRDWSLVGRIEGDQIVVTGWVFSRFLSCF